jgi:hypothetical protein
MNGSETIEVSNPYLPAFAYNGGKWRRKLNAFIPGNIVHLPETGR